GGAGGGVVPSCGPSTGPGAPVGGLGTTFRPTPSRSVPSCVSFRRTNRRSALTLTPARTRAPWKAVLYFFVPSSTPSPGSVTYENALRQEKNVAPLFWAISTLPPFRATPFLASRAATSSGR